MTKKEMRKLARRQIIGLMKYAMRDLRSLCEYTKNERERVQASMQRILITISIYEDIEIISYASGERCRRLLSASIRNHARRDAVDDGGI